VALQLILCTLYFHLIHRKVSYIVQEKLVALFTVIMNSTSFTVEVKVAFSKILKYCSDPRLECTIRSMFEILIAPNEPLTCVSELKLFLGIVDAMLNW